MTRKDNKKAETIARIIINGEANQTPQYIAQTYGVCLRTAYRYLATIKKAGYAR